MGTVLVGEMGAWLGRVGAVCRCMLPQQGSSAVLKHRQGAQAAPAQPGEERCQGNLVQGLCLAPVMSNRLLMGRDTALSACLGTQTLGSP